MRRAPVGLLMLVLPQVLWGATYVVTNLDDAGAGSLRQCIKQANTSAVSDTITFDKTLAGGIIRPTTDLPTLTGYYGDTLDGDVDDDGSPDFTLDGSLIESSGTWSGLVICRPETPAALEARLLDIPCAPLVRGCTIAGLAIVDFPRDGIFILGRGGNTVRACHIGLDRTGDVAVPNGDTGIVLWETSGNTIGGRTAADRNVIVAGPGAVGTGLWVGDSDDNVIIGNYFGTKPAGLLPCGGGGTCLRLERTEGNQIGGGGASRNIFCRYDTGVILDQTAQSRIQGNYFGLGSNGSTPISLGSMGIGVYLDSGENRIGGTTKSARNVFAGQFDAVVFASAGTRDNDVMGNDFGATADSGEQRDLEVGISIRNDAGAQTIGGTAAGAGNYFTPGAAFEAIRILGAGADTHVVGNSFGILRNGTSTDAGTGVEVTSVRAFITDNVFARLSFGVQVNLGGDARVFRNVFRACNIGVMIRGQASLGNLANASTADDGGNIFRTSNILHIWNGSSNRIRAEGNRFGTTVEDGIDAKIWDKLDAPTCGRVDFDPLAGGVHPTGDIVAGLQLTGTCAVPTKAGAEVAFTLSVPADVTVEVLNIAGRPIASVTADRSTAAGLQRLAWNGRGLNGTRAPSGQYLIRVIARSADGAQTSALGAVSLR